MKKVQPVTCSHGEQLEDLILCDLTPEQTGAREVWRAKASAKIVVTPFWCHNKCAWRARKQDQIKDALSNT